MMIMQISRLNDTPSIQLT